MFGLLKPKLPLDDEQREWADRSFRKLGTLLGARRLLDATVILPTEEHFPDPYDQSEGSLRRMVDRVATAMKVDPSLIDVELFHSEYDVSRTLLPFFSGNGSAARRVSISICRTSVRASQSMHPNSRTPWLWSR